MTIGTDAGINFFGTQDSLDNTSANVTNGAFSVAGDLLAWTNDDDAIEAAIILECNFSAAPDAGSTASLMARKLNIVSTNDQEIPDGNYPHTFLGFFPLNNVTTAQYIEIEISLPNGKSSAEYEFYIQNNSGQTMPAGWDLHITPKAVGPHA